MTYAVYLFRFPDGEIKQPDFDTFDMARLGPFKDMEPILQSVFPAFTWLREADGWVSRPDSVPAVSITAAPEDPNIVLCMYISNCDYPELPAISSSLDLLIWNPENERFFDPLTVSYRDP